MHKVCKNCGVSNSEQTLFCTKCGSALNIDTSPSGNIKEQTPAEQAAVIAKKTKAEVDKFTAKTKHLWGNFAAGEKIMAIGALISLIAFVLPWVSAGGKSTNGFGANSIYGYLLLLLIMASLVILYFTQGASDTHKVLMARWQIIIGSVAGAIGVLLVIFIGEIGNLLSQTMGGLGALFGGNSFGISAGIGAYLFVAGAVAIAVGAFKLQSELLRRNKENN